MWGGTPDRNMVSTMKGLPIEWDLKTGKNVKWVANVGSQTYGNPVVAEGVVLVGTNNEAVWDKAITGDKGILIAFRESDGEFLWQAVHDKLPAGRAVDWPFQGVCSSPIVENGVVYYVSNRGEVMAVDIQGFRNGNTGPYKDEKSQRETDVDIIWKYDMMEELGVMQHNMANSSPVIHGDLVYVSTSNGQDESHVNVPSPEGAGDHRAQQEDRRAGLGRQPRRREHPARPVVVACRRADRRPRAGGDRPGRRLRARLQRRDRRAAVVVRQQPEGLGLAEDAQRADQHADHRGRHRLHRQRAGSGARRGHRAPLRDRRHEARRHQPDAREGRQGREEPEQRRRSGTTPTSAARSRPARCTTGSSTTRTSAASCTPSRRRPASSCGSTTCSPPSGARRWSSTTRCTSATRTAT
jgi:hypothetical protein